MLPLAGLPKDLIASRLREFKDGKRPSTIMQQLAKGYTDQQIDHGVRALAVPLHNAAGDTVAALNVSCYSGRVSLQDLARRFLPRLQATARAIESDLRANVDAPALYGNAR